MAQEQGFGNTLVWLSIMIQRRYAQICVDHDLTPAQAQLLCMVKDEPRRMADLAAALGMAKNALSQLVDRTERRGFVHRDTLGPDRRVVLLSATPGGKTIAEALYADVATRLPDIAAHLGPDDQALVERLALEITAGRVAGF